MNDSMMPSYLIGESAIIVGRRSRKSFSQNFFKSFVAIIIIIAKTFAPKLQYFQIFYNNDDCCNEPLKKF